MFFSLNRKIIYSILALFLISSLLFVSAFYIAYSSKIETDQRASILRNQQYADLLYRNINLIKELKGLLEEYPALNLSEEKYPQVNYFVLNSHQAEFLKNEQKSIVERNKMYSKQYQAINNGVLIISANAIFLALFILLVGILIRKWVLVPVSKIANISEEVSLGKLGRRIDLRKNSKYFDEFDKLGNTFNMMLDNLQNMISAIRDKENFLQQLIDSIPDGIRVVDENYNIVIANKAYYAQVGAKGAKCKKCFEAVSHSKVPCEGDDVQCPVREILNKGKKSLTVVQRYANQPNKYMSIIAAPLLSDKRKKCIVESIRDLSKDIDFSHQQKVSSLGFLSSSIAHEMKNHLGTLRIITEHLIDKYYKDVADDNEQKKMINMIHSELVNAVNVPERLLKLTRNSMMVVSEIDVVASIKEVLDLMDFEAKSKGIDIKFESTKKGVFVKGNDTDFKIAVINIVLNAIKAMTNKGVLCIKLKESSKGGIKISFADNGIGIAKESLLKVFNPFFYDNHQGKAGAGSGLGLAITKSIVEKIGGTIEVSSTLGKGSCFTLSFPIKKKTCKK